MEINKDKLARLKARARAAGRTTISAAKDVKGSAIAVGGGVAAYQAAEKLLSKVDAINDRWWAKGAIMMLAGHIVRRKNQALGLSMIGAGSAMLNKAYDDHKAADSKTTTATVSSDASGPRISTRGSLPEARAAALLTARDIFRPQVQAIAAAAQSPRHARAQHEALNY